MLSLPLIAPRDVCPPPPPLLLFIYILTNLVCLCTVQSHELWFGSSQPYRSSSSSTTSSYPPHTHPSSSESSRRQAHNGPPSRAFIASATPSDSLAALQLEERALRVRKQNIASFGYAWIKPAGCPKTMLGMREEEAEREEGLAAAAAEMNAAAAAAAAAAGMGLDAFGDTTQGQLGLVGDGVDPDELERDLDDDIPDADAEGLVEEGEEGFEEDEDVDDDELMERNLDDDIPDAYDDNDDDGDNDDFDGDGFDDQPDLDDEIPTPEADEEDEGDEGEGFGDSIMGRNLDDDVPGAAAAEEEGSQQEEEWQHTDTEAEDDDDDRPDPFAEHFRTRTPGSGRGLPPQLPSVTREMDAQRRFLQRWGGGGGGARDSDVFDTSGMSLDDDDLRASITSQESIRRPSRFGRRFPRRGGPRDSLD